MGWAHFLAVAGGGAAGGFVGDKIVSSTVSKNVFVVEEWRMRDGNREGIITLYEFDYDRDRLVPLMDGIYYPFGVGDYIQNAVNAGIYAYISGDGSIQPGPKFGGGGHFDREHRGRFSEDHGEQKHSRGQFYVMIPAC